MPGFLPSELPVRAKVRQHPIVIVSLPSRPWLIFWAVALVAGYFWFNPIGWATLLALVGLIVMRYRRWRYECIYLTGKRIVRINGLPETTEVESWMRLDRISGARIEQSLPGRTFGWATILLEAPGDHPGTRELKTISSPMFFYGVLRKLIIDGPTVPDPGFVTAPLPVSADDEPPGDRRR